MDKRTKRRIREAKKRARSELHERHAWRMMNLARDFRICPEDIKARDRLERIDYNKVSELEFIDKYERNYKPVVITNAQKTWLANEKWTIERLAKKYRNQRFKCGEDDNGRSVRLKMKYYITYMKHNHDDSPLYIFDNDFGENVKMKKLLLDYSIPKYFRDDLFQFATERKRPPYRWFTMGTARSGTSIHIDPLGTSAWNALVRGHKWWCLFPTSCPKQILQLQPNEGWKNRSEGIIWFKFVYPRTQESSWPKEYKPIEILQRPGETIFVPGGWWHVVLNLDDTIAVTQNFCSVTNFPVVWHETVHGRPRLSNMWFKRLKVHKPELIAVAEAIDLSKPTMFDSDTSSSSSSSDTCSSCNSSSDSERSEASSTRRKQVKREASRSPNGNRVKRIRQLMSRSHSESAKHRNNPDNLSQCFVSRKRKRSGSCSLSYGCRSASSTPKQCR